MIGIFSKMPIQVWTDHRLTLKQIRVLGAILSFADKDGAAHPKTEAIAERCGMRANHVSTATSQLASLGWITKEGRGGYSMPATYQLHIPETLPELGREEHYTIQVVKTENNPPRIVDETLPELGSKTLPELGRGKEQTIEQTNTDHSRTCLDLLLPVADEKPKREKKTPVTLSRFLADCASGGELPIPEDDPIFESSKKVNIPDEFLHLCWLEFKDKHLADRGTKRQKDWRATFRNCVRSNWYKLWYTNADGSVVMGSNGHAAKLRHREAA